jgi:glycosyltransferase involved in cell wall biosynthesis
MVAMYEYWIDLKIQELRRPWDALTRRFAEPAGEPRPSPIDVLIVAGNEAGNIAEAVASARQVGQVFVVDSCSTDGTQELARQAGATVVEHPFEGYARQKNWALDNLPWTGRWTLILDADERIPAALRDELLRRAEADPPIDGYLVNRLTVFMGRPIRHGGLYPSWNLRFFRRGCCRYEDRSVHEHMVASGPTGYLRQQLLHLRREPISQYLLKHIRYADLESDEWVKRLQGRSGEARAEALFPSRLRYRQWLRRSVWPRLPWRPLWRFVYMYIVRLGFLDGAAGWHLALLMANYEYMIRLLTLEKLGRLPGLGSNPRQ